MSAKLALIRLPILLLVIFFLGKLILGATGVSYESGTQVFAMVPLTVHLCLIWGALSRTYQGYRIGGAATTGLLIALVAQILILGGTAVSYILGVDTYFSDPMAIVREARPVPFAEAMGARIVGLVLNSIIGLIVACIGWALGRLLPSKSA